MMFATVQTRYSSSGAGSFTSGFRCNRIPIGRCSRSACCAAATDLGRAMVIGATAPGNSTMLRTATMIRASSGMRAASRAGLVGIACSLSDDMASFRLCQTDRDTAVHGEAVDRIASSGQRDPALEPALRNLEPVNAGVAEFRRQGPAPADDEHAVLDDGLDPVRLDARQRDQDEQFVVGFQDVDRWLPARFARTEGGLQVEELLAQPLGASQRADRL